MFHHILGLLILSNLTHNADNRTLATEIPQAMRQNTFGSYSPPLKPLATDSEWVLSLARSTLQQVLGAEAPKMTTTYASRTLNPTQMRPTHMNCEYIFLGLSEAA